MIARNWTKHSAMSQVIDPRHPSFSHASIHVNDLAGAIRRCDAQKRDREVPYGMKGGEH
jgi:hypothetical protein